jgi:hypothetical protein
MGCGLQVKLKSIIANGEIGETRVPEGRQRIALRFNAGTAEIKPKIFVENTILASVGRWKMSRNCITPLRNSPVLRFRFLAFGCGQRDVPPQTLNRPIPKGDQSA